MGFATNSTLAFVCQERTVRNCMLHLPRSAWKPGMVAVYLLREDQFPTHPGKEWRGKIKRVYSSIDALEVEILDRGYEGLEERVYLYQIVRVESEMAGR